MPINPQAEKVYVINQKPVPVSLNGETDAGNSTPIAVKSLTATASCTGGINLREDQ